MRGAQPLKVLIVDDDPLFVKAAKRDISAFAETVWHAGDGEEAIKILETVDPDVVLTDMELPGMRGDQLLDRIRQDRPDLTVVLISGLARVSDAVWALKNGAFDYIEKPYPSADFLGEVLSRAAQHTRLKRRNAELEAVLDSGDAFSGLIGTSAPMRQVYRLIDTVAPSDATVLIVGESGTGKELTARAIHDRSTRRQKPFIAVNCSELNDSLLESELFGHVRGAFTGADVARKGLFEAAEGGTIFLDEIGHMSTSVQTRLLRVLQEREVRRVGSSDPIGVDVRVVAATNANLQQAVEAGTFRLDLFYRLNVVDISLPPLRERTDDIAVIATHLAKRYALKSRKRIAGFTPEALAVMQAHNWPGNVRELDNVVQRAVLMASSERIEPADMPLTAVRADMRPKRPTTTQTPAPDFEEEGQTYSEMRKNLLRTFERQYLESLMQRAGDNLSEAARLSGIDRTNLRRMLKEHGLREAQVPSTRRDLRPLQGV
jgi:DNA-binding NtrC family response regulator